MINTLQLFQHPQLPDAWHNVTAPGGYEWWYFDAEDVERDRQIVAILFDGFVFHPEYLRRYFRYAKHPTHFAPPRPNEYICAYFVVYHAGRIEHQFLTQYPAEQFEARHDKRHVSLGPNEFTAGNALEKLKLAVVGTPWKLTGRGPQLQKEWALIAYLNFSSRFKHSPGEREFFSRTLVGAEHRWILANPLCDVEGEIVLPGLQKTPFRGRGYHDHNFGTGPIGPGIKQWVRGRVLLDD